MKILQVSLADVAGGAEKVAWNLFQAYRQQGHQSRLAVGIKHTDDQDISAIPHSAETVPWARPLLRLHHSLGLIRYPIPGIGRLRYWLATLAGGWPEIERQMGREDFHFPASHQLLRLATQGFDIVHAHNLHGNYFDLRLLVELSRTVPVVLTLHDEWLLTGHCAYSFECARWQSGCGKCPDLTIYPAIVNDATAWNWKRKQHIYRSSHLWISTPSHWLAQRVQVSMLNPAEIRVIPYGVDLQIFHPGNQLAARTKLGLPAYGLILLFTSNGGRKNIFKDFATIEQAVKLLTEHATDRPIVLVALGSQDKDEQFGQIQIRHIPFQSDSAQVAEFYRAADIFLHAAKAENFPNTILEAFACGKPVIATDVGGISEQVAEGVTGWLIPAGDANAMAERILRLMRNKELHTQMATNAVVVAQQRFDLKLQVDAYLAWYQHILEQWSRSHAHTK